MRRIGPFLLAVVFGAITQLPPNAASAQDFDPAGRRRGRPSKPQPAPRPAQPGTARPGTRPATSATPATPGQPSQPTAQPSTKPGEQPGETKSPQQNVLIERYTRIVLAQPGSPFPLQRLAQLYRDRDGNVHKLVVDFEQRAAAAGPEQYSATVTLAGLYKIDGRAPDAIRTYEKAIALKSDDATAILSLARLLQDRGDTAPARQRYEQALALQTIAADKEQTVRTLMGLALDQKDWEAAKRFHTQLVRMQPTSLFVKGELGRELYNRAEYGRAEGEFKDLVTAAAGDNRALAPALKELGKAQAKAEKRTEALATLKRALGAAGQEAAVRAEIYEIITEIYRADQQLPVLVKQIEDERPGDFARLSLLGGLYEEIGETAKAIETYRRALAINPRHIDLRLKMIRLLQANGDLDRAIAEYESLIRSAPNNPAFVFEQCEALLQRGDRTRAMRLLTELESRAHGDEDILSRVADYYGRIGENEKALHVLQRLASLSTTDPGHLVDLGDRYFQDGNTPLAVQTWKRMLVSIVPRARALSALGDVYLEHEMIPDALSSFKEAVQLDPANLGYKKQLAQAYERAKNYREAGGLYREIAEKAKQSGDKTLAREARTRIVSLWALERSLDSQIKPLSTAFAAKPPDLEAGRMLAEVQIHLRKLPDAEVTLRRIIELAPTDAESYLALERVFVQENKLPDAIALLDKLVQAEPKRARELYQRMAQYALQIYKDDDAIKYAARAVELNPDDAEGHRRLGEMYRSRQDTEHAIAEFRAAIAKNDRLYLVYFQLADLLLAKNQSDEADRLLRRVLRGAPDEELVARAARLSMQINLGKGTLESLEQDLLPLAIGNPQKPIYRRLLVEIYGNLTFGLVQRVKHASGAEAEETRSALAKIGNRAIKPLLDALADADVGQQRIAIDVLGFVQNKNAALPLFSYATGQGDIALRTRAMMACGKLRDPGLTSKLEALLFPKDAPTGEVGPTDSVALAATWALSRGGDARAIPVLRRLVSSGTSGMRSLAALGLGSLGDKGSAHALALLAQAPEAGSAARAAGAYALGQLGAEQESSILVALAQGNEPLTREMAILSLARMGTSRGEPVGGRAALAAIADAVFASTSAETQRAQAATTALRHAATIALTMLAAQQKWPAATDSLAATDASLDAEVMLESLVPQDPSAEQRATAFVKFAPVLQRAAQKGLQTSAERASVVLEAISAEGAFEPFVSAASATQTPALESARAKAREVARALEDAIIPLARHPDSTIRAKAVVLLARSSTDGAAEAIVDALDDATENVQRVALSAVGRYPSARATAAATRILSAHSNWSVRVLAAEAIGRLGRAGSKAEAVRALERAARTDAFSLVRESAIKALATFDKGEAKKIAADMQTKDPEPRVQEVARGIVRGD